MPCFPTSGSSKGVENSCAMPSNAMYNVKLLFKFTLLPRDGVLVLTKKDDLYPSYKFAS